MRSDDEDPVAKKYDGQQQISHDQRSGPEEEMAENVETISHVEDGLVLRQRHPVADGQGVEVHGKQGHIPQLAR